MKNQIADRIASSFIGLLVLIVLEGIFTLGQAFNINNYNWFIWIIQVMLVYLALWGSGKIKDIGNPR